MQKVSKELVDGIYTLVNLLHIQIIEKSGGEQGIRDEGGLFHSLYKVLQKVKTEKIIPSAIAAFAYKEIARKHHFMDGNKRTAHLVASIALFLRGYQLSIEYKESTNFIIQIAAYNSEITTKQIQKWVEENLQKLETKDMGKYLNKILHTL